MRRTLLALTVPLLVLTGACGTPQVSTSDLEAQITTQLTRTVGQRPDDVTCPHPLDAKVGATTRCTLTADGAKYGVTVKATKVQGRKVAFAIKVDDKPKS